MLYALLIVFFVQSAEAQTVEKLKLKRFYRPDYLDVTIDAIGKDTDLRFVYDKEHLHRYKLAVDPLSSDSKVKTVGAVLSQGGSTSSATLVDVKGNIDGGYGIFTGISSVKRTIHVSQGSSPF